MRTLSGAADSKDTRPSLGREPIGLVQWILQESSYPETAVLSLSAAFVDEATIKGQAAKVLAGASLASKCFAELFVYLPTEDVGEGAREISLCYKDLTTVQKATAKNMLAGYANNGSHHAFLVCVTRNPLHPEPVVVPIFSLASMPAGDGAQRHALAGRIIACTNNSVERGLPRAVLTEP